MADVVRRIGTAASSHLEGIDFAGKTGSAQTISLEARNKMGAEGKKKFKDNGWFVGVTPRRNPEIVVARAVSGRWVGLALAAAGGAGDQGVCREAATLATQCDAVAAADDPAVKGRKMSRWSCSGVWHEPDGSAQAVATDMQGGRMKTSPGKGKTSGEGSARCRCRRAEDQRGETVSRYVSFRDFDWVLLVFVLMICGLGVMEIHSATYATKFRARTSSRCTGSSAACGRCS